MGGILPLALLTHAPQRAQSKPLLLGALLTTLGVVFNRVNVVVLAMHLKGPMPQVAPEAYSPSIFEWGISVGLIARLSSVSGLARGFCRSSTSTRPSKEIDFMTRDVWLARHPYLQAVADLHARVDTALTEVSISSPAIPMWDDYLDDFYAGVSPLRSSAHQSGWGDSRLSSAESARSR